MLFTIQRSFPVRAGNGGYDVPGGSHRRPNQIAKLASASLTVLALVAPATVAASPTWLGPTNFVGWGTDVAVNAQGDAVAAWLRYDGSSQIVQATSRRAGGEWTPQRPISKSGEQAYGYNSPSPQVAIDQRGNAVTVWNNVIKAPGDEVLPGLTINEDAVQVATRPADGDWSGPQRLSPLGQLASSPDIALDDQGGAVAVWQRRDPTDNRYTVQAATRSADGTWSPAQDLSTAGEKDYPPMPKVAVSAQGVAVAIWMTTGGVQASSRSLGGNWSEPQTLQAGEPFPPVEVAMNGQGDAVAVWARTNPGLTIESSTRPAGGSWTSTNALSEAGADNTEPHVALDPRGDAAVVWTRANNIIQAATRPEGGTWSSAQNVSAPGPGFAGAPKVGLDSQGNAVAMWNHNKDNGWIIESATRRVGDTWSVPLGLTALNTFGSPDMGVDAQGNAVTTWDDGSATSGIVQAVGFDAAGPQLRGLSVPDSGAVGTPLSFSVAPLDVWSALASTRWDFGDGSGADGASVSHVYSSPGSFPVTVRSTDSLGNASTETRTVAVQGPAASVSPTSGTVTPSISGASVVVPAGGGAQLGVVPVADVGAAEAQRLLAFRRCMSLARASSGAVRLRAQRRCVSLYGRTPGRVSGLRARAVSGKNVALSFLAPGTDGLHPPAARSYVVKQSTRPVTDLRSFRRARTLCAGSCRFGNVRLGQRVSLTVTDLRAQRAYYYAVRARDNVTGRPGPRSRTVAVRAR